MCMQQDCLQLYGICYLQFNNLTLCDNVMDEPLAFSLTAQPSSGEKKVFYILTADEGAKQSWVNAIQGQIDLQGDFMRGEWHPKTAFQVRGIYFIAERYNGRNTSTSNHYTDSPCPAI